MATIQTPAVPVQTPAPQQLMQSIRRRLAWLALLAGAALLLQLTACGGGDDDTAATPDPAASTPAVNCAALPRACA